METQIEFEEFNLFTLSFERFCILYLLLELNQLKADIPLKLKHETLSEEKQITDNFYADYSTFKRLLFEDLCENNLQSEECHAELVSASDDEIPNQVRNDDGKINKLLLFKKTQKLLDRILFILFCEDRNLLPPNSIAGIISDYQKLKEMGYGQPLYNVFKTYFDRIDKGYKNESDSSKNVFAYNGGLFKTDEVLDNIKVGDHVLYIHSKRLADYDFESQISVDILGRIFENSLTEIEEVQKEIEAEKTGAKVENNNVGKRKKDGVFYTPEYITKYIVENTIGKLCEEKREELKINDEEFSPEKNVKTGDDKKTVATKQKITAELDERLENYRKWLLDLKILDPACGSGAFLNAALQQLKIEHTLIDYYWLNIHAGELNFTEIENTILENNLYGVDINEESVEIAKLSLWLHTAKKNRKLTTLNGKIKCGNSLIDDPSVAGEKAFKWEEEFPEVFAKGGFDVVIGNPPYVRVQQLDYATIDSLKKTYKTALKRIDISLCFIEKSRNLIKNNGLVSFITSNQFLTTEYGQAMRNFLLSEFFLTECVDFGDLPIFKDAMTYVSIFKFTKEKQDSFGYKKIKDIQIAKTGHYSVFKKIELSQLNDSNWNLESSDLKKIHNKIESVSLKIDEIGNAWYGIVTGADSVFIFDKETYQKTNIEKEIFLPLMRAQNCSKNFCSDAEKFVLYPYKIENNNTVLINEAELSSKYPNAFNYLLEHKDELEARKDSRSTFKGRTDWYCLTRFGQLEIFRKNKILTPGEVKEHKFCINNSCAGYSGARVFAIVIDDENFDLKYVLCLLNSDLMKSYLQSFSSLKAGGYYSYSSNILNRTPIKNISL
ncbi:MAG: N-6 DNA methylase [Spirochaetia bacterium]|nr:N-6 DNA methylase [Spirochaetia bacterium]